VLYLDEIQRPPTVRCRCGFNLVDSNHIRGLVNSQQRLFAEQEEKARLEKERREREEKRQERRRAKEEKLRATRPSAAQQKRGAIHPVECGVCGNVTFRRRGEVAKGGPYFCKRAHQDQWQKENPVGMFRIRKEAS